MKPKRRRKCPTCGRIVTVKADRFIDHLVASYSMQYCPGGGDLVLDESSNTGKP